MSFVFNSILSPRPKAISTLCMNYLHPYSTKIALSAPGPEGHIEAGTAIVPLGADTPERMLEGSGRDRRAPLS
jgi:hypothetical protein